MTFRYESIAFDVSGIVVFTLQNLYDCKQETLQALGREGEVKGFEPMDQSVTEICSCLCCHS